MKFRLATENDIPKINIMFKFIIENMNKHNLDVWNDLYPFCEFENDVKNNSMYVFENNNSEIIASITICDKTAGFRSFAWENKKAPAYYLDRLAVNVKFLKQGLGSKLIQEIEKIAKLDGIEYLRLLVVNSNTPAINFYLKNGFTQVKGKFKEYIKEQRTNMVYFAYEKKLA